MHPQNAIDIYADSKIHGEKILIDPLLKGSPAFTNQSFENVISGVTHIALTHGHSDHLGDTVEIAKELNAMVIANADLCSYLRHLGVQKLTPGNTGGTVQADNFSMTFAFEVLGPSVAIILAFLLRFIKIYI